MEAITAPLSRHEEIILGLRSLYSQYGYSRCRVRTFEEYDFYTRCRSALPGENVLVFTDADGRLMALKPDVTMSIVKNIQNGRQGLQKLCYNENVYRIPTGGTGFRESVQTGLECIGALDDYTVGEVLMLAVRSLQSIHPRSILNLSHMGIVDGILDQAMPDNGDRTGILKAMEQKNLAALDLACKQAGVPKKSAEDLRKLTGLFGPLKETLSTAEEMAGTPRMQKACEELRKISDQIEAYGLQDRIHLDFSIRGGTDYYSGLVFRGLVDGISAPVLMGGRYDTLIRRMGKSESGIGFAVYLDQLEYRQSSACDGVIYLLYDDSVSPEQVLKTVQSFVSQGRIVRAGNEIPPDLKGGTILKLTQEGVKEIAGLH